MSFIRQHYLILFRIISSKLDKILYKPHELNMLIHSKNYLTRLAARELNFFFVNKQMFNSLGI